MLRLIGYGTAILLVVLVALIPLWIRLGTDAVVPIAVAVLHGLGMTGLAQWALAGGRQVTVIPRPADYITMTRSMIGSGCLAVVMTALVGHLDLPSWWLAALAIPALLLDAVDGPVARRTGTATAAGGRYDLECDAVFVLIIAIGAALVHGPWVLVLGMIRYLFVIVSMFVPRLRQPLAYSRLRRAIAAVQGTVLVIAITPGLPTPVNVVLLAVTIGMLLVSFGRDVVDLLGRPVPTTSS